MVIMIYRPSPQIPEPSVMAAQLCYDASAFNVRMHKEQMSTGSVDLTWASTQSLCMAVNTMLWTLSYPEIRAEHDIEEVKSYLQIALEALAISAPRWPGCQSVLQLYKNLIAACLKSYDTAESFVVHTPSTQPSPSSIQDATTPPCVSSPSARSHHSVQTVTSAATTVSEPEKRLEISRDPSTEPLQRYVSGQEQAPIFTSQPSSSSPTYNPSQVHVPSYVNNITPTADKQKPKPNIHHHHRQQPSVQLLYGGYSDPNFDPTTPFNTFPSVVPGLPGWDPTYAAISLDSGGSGYGDSNVVPDSGFWLGPFGDQCSQYSNQPGPWRGRTLSQEEQIELMDSLADNIPDVSSMLTNDSTIYYRT